MAPSGRFVAASNTSPVSPCAAAYCRRARRLRGAFAHQPARLHRELRALAATQPGAGPIVVARSRTGGFAAEFAARVEGDLEGSVLRYARRRALIAEANRLGIGNFEANLIIAAVQHQRRGAAVPVPTGRAGSPVNALHGLLPLLVIVLVEAAIAIGAWRVLGA